MKIEKIKISNYRILKDFELDLEEDLSLLVGKNNTGKTSLLSLLEKFLNPGRSAFTFKDINVASQEALKEDINREDLPGDYSEGIQLRLYIKYCEEDNLKNVSKFMLNLNPSDNFIVLSFHYVVDWEAISKLRGDFSNYINSRENPDKDLLDYLTIHHANYFKRKYRALEYNNESNAINIQGENKTIDKVIDFKCIRAKRSVNNSGDSRRASDKTLSRLSSLYYGKESTMFDENAAIDNLRKSLSLVDKELTEAYSEVFKELTGHVEKFGGVEAKESVVKIISALDERKILEDNTSVIYEHDGHQLPEDYNGLGYMNLIAIIFEIGVFLNDFKKKYNPKESPADICLFFIEEPEVHTHPQMQHIFIKNIKELLQNSSYINDDSRLNLQTLISTHSPHIVAESEFDDIKYLFKDAAAPSSVKSRNLKNLEQLYRDGDQYNFLKKYLTINRAELFFADKAILVEGATERILLPVIMKKIDLESRDNTSRRLLSQNISIVEVGAYAHIFKEFIHFLNIRVLIVTDIDSVNKENRACPVAEGEKTSNTTLKYFFKNKPLRELQSLAQEQRTLHPVENKEQEWESNEQGLLLVQFQQEEEEGYCARSFEEAFIQTNRQFIRENINGFKSLKNKSEFEDDSKTPDELANNIEKKTDFALGIIFHSSAQYSNWVIPKYIKEGLTWLKQGN